MANLGHRIRLAMQEQAGRPPADAGVIRHMAYRKACSFEDGPSDPMREAVKIAAYRALIPVHEARKANKPYVPPSQMDEQGADEPTAA